MRTEDLDKVLIDTSVWIEFFRKQEPYFSAVQDLIEEDRVCCVGLIYAELLQGAKSENEINTLREFIHVFDFIPELPAIWEKAGLMLRTLKKKGKSIGLADCFIASCAVSCRAEVLTLDRHFDVIKKLEGLALYKP